MSAIEILALDTGPGMADVDKCLRDGYSTGGTQGTGLGAVTRLSSDFDIHSSTATGTAIWSRIWDAPKKPDTKDKSFPSGFDIGVVCLPVKHEIECGDGWAVLPTNSGCRCIVVDGLGHGPLAAQAASAALTICENMPQEELESTVTSIHNGIRHTRGAALAIADIGYDDVSYVGVGNIIGILISDNSFRNMVSHNGTAGHQLHKVQKFHYASEAGTLIVLHSDGINSHWRIDKYHGLTSRHPSLIAGVIYRDSSRERDDTTVLVVRKECAQSHKEMSLN